MRAAIVVMIMLAGSVGGCGEKPESAAEPPTAVSIVQVGTATGATGFEAAGTVALRKETVLAFTTPGRIAAIRVNEGDRVARGQLLAALDTTTVNASLAAAASEQVRADADYRRLAALHEKGWITRARFETAKATRDASRANVAAQRFSVDTARIYAPSSGIVLLRAAEPAQVVAAGTPVITLGEVASGYVLRVPVSDRDVAQIVRGQVVMVTLEGLGGVALPGAIIEVGGKGDRTTGSFTVEVALGNDPRLRSGMIGRASFAAAGAQPTTVTVPPAALFAPRAGEAFVYVVGGDKIARVRKIQVGEVADRGARVISGIAPGEWVAVSAIDRLRDGQRVAPAKRLK